MTTLLPDKPHDLPSDPTSFVGRRAATAEVKHALSAARLVTLTGVGGVGKSRLAVHVARSLRRAFPDGVCLVELASVDDPELVARAVAASMDLLDQSERDPSAVLMDYLVDKQLLLLLDNCEHVLYACCRLVAQLLSFAPGLRVLATSREPLGIAAERIWPVPPLAVPSVNGHDVTTEWAEAYEAVSLFEERATAAVPGFTVGPENATAVARLCQRLDGVPLALELAAVQVRALSVEQILARLENRFRLLTVDTRGVAPRHQTLRAAVDWSFDLCSSLERTLWARCSVFSGRFDLEAVEAVCSGDGVLVEDVFQGVAGLVDKSVLTGESDGQVVRYRMLDTIRQYGAERLRGDETTVRRRHRDYYLRLARQADAESCGPAQAEWARRLRAERANLWAALDYCLTTPGEARDGLRLATALWFYWVACGMIRDGRYWLNRALESDPDPSSERAKALWVNGLVAYSQGDNAAQAAFLTEAQDLARQLGDESALRYATQFFSDTELLRDSPEALRLQERTFTQHSESEPWTAPGLIVLGQLIKTNLSLGRIDAASGWLDEGEAICESLGETWILSWLRWERSLLCWSTGEFAEASDYARQCLHGKAELDDQFGIPFCVELLAWLASTDGDARRAALLFGGAQKMWRLIGRPLFGFESWLEWQRQAMTRAREALGEQKFNAVSQEGARLDQSDIIIYALGEKIPAPRDKAEMPLRGPEVLTKRELEVADLVAAGKSNKEIAATLVVSQRTAESHIEHILRKLAFSSRAQIAVWSAKREPDQRSGAGTYPGTGPLPSIRWSAGGPGGGRTGNAGHSGEEV